MRLRKECFILWLIALYNVSIIIRCNKGGVRLNKTFLPGV